MADAEGMKRTNYFPVIKAKEEEFRKLVDNLPDVKLVEKDGLFCLYGWEFSYYDEAEEEHVEGIDHIVYDFLALDGVLIFATSCHEKACYTGGSADAWFKDAAGQIEHDYVCTFAWCQKKVEEFARRGIKTNIPEY